MSKTDKPSAPLRRRKPKGNAVADLKVKFEGAARHDEVGEYWSARDLGALLGYSSWQRFQVPIERAKAACVETGEDVADHFNPGVKMVELGSDAMREIDDIELTRFACYLIAQNGDPSQRPEIAAAQTYFAVQTRRQEITDMAEGQPPALTEDERRVLLRDEMKEHSKSLVSAAKGHGVKEPRDYAIFQNKGYEGLYGGLDCAGIQRRRRLDRMPSAELAANLFRATQTEERLNRLQEEGRTGKKLANDTHYTIGKKVRDTIADIGGTMPEAYAAVEHIKEARNRVKKADSKPKLAKKP